MKLPELTQQPIEHVDATPDKGYPIRILKAYRENCNCKFEAHPPDPIWDMMNQHNDERAEILDKAIRILENELK